jgi:hypothetical protein
MVKAISIALLLEALKSFMRPIAAEEPAAGSKQGISSEAKKQVFSFRASHLSMSIHLLLFAFKVPVLLLWLLLLLLRPHLCRRGLRRGLRPASNLLVSVFLMPHLPQARTQRHPTRPVPSTQRVGLKFNPNFNHILKGCRSTSRPKQACGRDLRFQGDSEVQVFFFSILDLLQPGTLQT